MKGIDTSVRWQDRRDDLNHQWLKNQLLSALDSAANLLQGRLASNTYLQEVFSVDIAAWPSKEAEIRLLLSEFVSEMSPRTLFEVHPFLDWEPRFRTASQDLVFELWVSRYAIYDLLNEAYRALELASRCFTGLSPIIQRHPLEFLPTDLPFRLAPFREACRLLGCALDRFPSKVLVT